MDDFRWAFTADEQEALTALAEAGMLAQVAGFEYEKEQPVKGSPEFQRDGTVTWKNQCPRCLQPSEVRKLDPFAVNSWQSGEHVQNAFPFLSVGECETLISGLHDECFEIWFAPSE